MREVGQGTISSTQITSVVSTLRELGIPEAPILRAAGLEPAELGGYFARVPVDAEHRLWSAIEQQTGDPAIGLRIGVAFAHKGRHTVDLYLAVHSGTPRAAFRNVQRFARLTDDLGHAEVIEQGETATARVYRDGGVPRAAGAVDAMFSAGITLLRDRVAGFSVTGMQLSRPRPACVAPYRELYGVTPAFGESDNAYSFDRVWLDTPIRGSDEVLAEILVRQAMSLLRETPGVHPLIARVQKAVLDGLALGATSLSVVARATGTSPRTLRRRLSSLGVSFQALLDALRRELAGQYLRSGDESVAGIADRLGFASPSAFQRAFQRWEQMPPSTYRRLARVDATDSRTSADLTVGPQPDSAREPRDRSVESVRVAGEAGRL